MREKCIATFLRCNKWKIKALVQFHIEKPNDGKHIWYQGSYFKWTYVGKKYIISCAPPDNIYNSPSTSTYFSSFYRYQTIANGTLRINSVQEGDEGSYQCVVRNDGDSAQATGSLLLGGKLNSYHSCLHQLFWGKFDVNGMYFSKVLEPVSLP